MVTPSGKSDFSIYTADATTYNVDVPEEYVEDVTMIKFSDDEPIEGETVIINATILNVGTRGASATVYFYDGPPEDEDLIGSDTLSIHPLGYGIASTPWDTTNEDEYHRIHVIIVPDDPDNENNESNNEASRDIVVNQIPIADAGQAQNVLEDELVSFDGSSSTDTQSDLAEGLTYTWTFADPYANTSNPNTLSGKTRTLSLPLLKKSCRR